MFYYKYTLKPKPFSERPTKMTRVKKINKSLHEDAIK